MNFRFPIAIVGVALTIRQPAVAPADPITITCHEGRTITLAKPAERIVSSPNW